MLLAILLEAAALGLVMRRHRWAPWAMIPLLLGHAGAIRVAAAFLVPSGDSNNYLVLLWGVQLLLGAAGLILLFRPASGAWLRSGTEA
jgi:LPXTG-motif cell wall-anchored protein